MCASLAHSLVVNLKGFTGYLPLKRRLGKDQVQFAQRMKYDKGLSVSCTRSRLSPSQRFVFLATTSE